MWDTEPPAGSRFRGGNPVAGNWHPGGSERSQRAADRCRAGVGRRAPGLVLQSSNALLFDPSDGGVLYAKGAGERIYPASLTKVMTAYAALEKIENLDAPVMLIYEDYAGLYEANASMAGFAMGRR